jgi:hypothetical protein
MLPVRTRKFYQGIILLLACLAVMAVVECQFHNTLLDQGHAIPSRSYPSAVAHASLLDFSCMGMSAVLPTIAIFASFLFHVWHATPLVLNPAVLAFLPFIPPRQITS